MESIDSPSAKLITDKDEAMTSCHTSHEKYSWLLEMSQNISENIIGDQFETATSQTPQNFRDGLWVCLNCNKTYRQNGWLDRHHSSVHNITAESDRPMESDDANSIARSFMKVALLIRDTDRAIKCLSLTLLTSTFYLIQSSTALVPNNALKYCHNNLCFTQRF